MNSTKLHPELYKKIEILNISAFSVELYGHIEVFIARYVRNVLKVLIIIVILLIIALAIGIMHCF